MKSFRNALRFAAAFVAALGFAGTADAGSVSPALRNAVKSAPPGQELAVIITLADRVDARQYALADRRSRDGKLVKALKDKAAKTQGELKKFLKSLGKDAVQDLWVINGVAVTVPAALVDLIAALPGVASVRPDSLAVAPGVAAGSPGQPEWNIDAIHAPGLWSRGFTGAGMVVANMDTGVDAQHPELSGKWRGGTNSWYDPYGQHATPYDPSGHGTQTMALIVGGAGAGTSIGVAPGASWIAAKIYNDAGQATYSQIHLAFQWLLDPDGNPDTADQPDVVNASWGLVGTSGQCIMEFDTDIEMLKAAGIAVAFAAGNDGPAPATSLSAANNPSSFAVGAVDFSLAVAGFSARGPSACTGGIFPHIAAPGVNVNTADLSFGGLPFYVNVSGTSYAAPHAAGSMALLMSAFPSATVPQLETALMQSAGDFGPAGADNSYGFGLLDALAAYLLLGGSSGSPPSITSTPITTATQGTQYNYTVTATDPAGSTLTYSLVTAPSGMTIMAVTGAISWTPTAAQAGPNAVTARVTNAQGLAASQSFTIQVARLNVAPVATNEAYATLQGTTLTVATPGVLANDSDADGDPITAVLFAAPTKGTLTLAANGGFTYVPNAGATGTDTFKYRAFDGLLYSAAATVTITLNPNHAPVAVNDSASAPVRGAAAYTPVVINVLANDTDADGNLDRTTVTITTAPGNGGSASANANGTVSYTPKKSFRGTETFKYKVRDTSGALSNAATVTVTVQ